MIRLRLRVASIVAAAAFATPAFAHHATGGAMPKTLAQGFLSGLAHPVIGLDHLAAIVGIGLLAALLGQGARLILLFSAAMIGGVGLHLAKLTIPSAELYVALATLAIGALVAVRGLNAWIATTFVAAGGIVHGYALGESIVGAEQTPLAAYLLGLFVIQCIVGSAAFSAARVVIARHRDGLFPLTGGAIAIVGAVFAVTA